MRKSELVRAIEVLSAANETPELVSVLQEIVSDPESGDYVRLIDREKYFATILWQTDDIRSGLEDQGIEPTDENVDRVFENLGISEMENCSHGWECIYEAIGCAFDDDDEEENDCDSV